MEKKLFVLILLIISWPSVCWASQGGFRICFKETERSSQCQGPSHTCSGWSNSPAWSESFRDDTDNRGGGCQYQWRIEAQGTINPEMEYRLCFKETEGSSQCQGTRSSCTGWTPSPSWTDRFRDDTDNRGGGCRYAWKIESRSPQPGSPFRCVAYALRKSRAALSVREIVKVAADGALRAVRIPRGHCLSVMIPTTVAEVALTSGFSIVPRWKLISSVKEIAHVIEILQETTFFSPTPAKACVTDIFSYQSEKPTARYICSKCQFSLALFRSFED